MTPGSVRWLLLGTFGLSSVVVVNALFLQPVAPANQASRAGAEKAAVRAAVVATPRKPAVKPTVVEPAPIIAPQARIPDWAPFGLDFSQRRAADSKNEQKNGPRVAMVDEAAPRTARLKPDSANSIALPNIPDAEGDETIIRAVQRELQHRGYGPLVINGNAGPLTRAAIMAFEYDHNMPLTGEASETFLRRLGAPPTPAKTPDPGARKVRSAEAEGVIRRIQQSLTELGYQPGRIDGRIGDETERAIREFEMDNGLGVSGRVSAELFSRLARAVGAKSAATR